MAASPRLELVFHERRAERVSLTIDRSTESSFFAGLSGDVATDGGVFVATWRPLATGTEVELTIDLAGETLVMRGFVTWQRDPSDGAAPGYGVALDAMSDEARAQIEGFATLRAPLFVDVE